MFRTFKIATLFCVVCFGEVVGVKASIYSDMVVADGPLSYWRCNETTGSVIVDSVNSHNGTATSGVQLGQPSLLPVGDPTANAIKLPSSGYGVTIPGFEKFPAGSTGYTLEYWLKINTPLSYFTSVVSDCEGSWYMMNYLSPEARIRSHFWNASYFNGNGVIEVQG